MVAITCAGSINYDMIFFLDKMPTFHSKMRSKQTYKGLGGSAANTASWLGHIMNEPIKLIGFLGDDMNGQTCRQALRAGHLDDENVLTIDNWTTPMAVSLISEYDKRIITSKQRVPIKYFEDVKVPIGTHIHFSGNNNKLYEVILKRCISNEQRTYSADLSGRLGLFVRKNLDIGFINRDELLEIYKLNLIDFNSFKLKKILPKVGALLIITDGNQSIYVAREGKLRKFDVNSLEIDRIIDRTGAGDAFNAGFLASWLQEHNLEKAINFGEKTAVKCLLQLGGIKF